MNFDNVTTALILASTCISCWTSCLIIRSYMRKKPLGQQTFLNKVILEHIKAYLALVTITNFLFYFMAISCPIEQNLAEIGFYIVNFSLNYWLLWLITVIIIKYISIFYGYIIEEMGKSDNEMIHLTKIIIWILFLFLYCIEHLYIQELDESAIYQFLVSKPMNTEGHRSIPKTTSVLVLLAVLAIGHLHFKMEATGMKSDGVKMSKNHRILLRITVGLICSTIVYVIYALATVDLDDYFTRLTHGWIVPIFTATLPPILFIVKNPKLRMYALKSVLFWRSE